MDYDRGYNDGFKDGVKIQHLDSFVMGLFVGVLFTEIFFVIAMLAN